jgi:spore maturation protein A
MLNYIWFGLIIVAVLLGGINGKIEAVTKAGLDSAGNAVTLAIGLIGVMALWLGIMKIADEAGLMKLLSRAIAPVLRLVFPTYPAITPRSAA